MPPNVDMTPFWILVSVVTLTVTVVATVLAYLYLPTIIAIFVPIVIVAVIMSSEFKLCSTYFLCIDSRFEPAFGFIVVPYGLQIPSAIAYALVGIAAVLMFAAKASVEKTSETLFSLGLAPGLAVWAFLSLVGYNLATSTAFIYMAIISAVMVLAYIAGDIRRRKQLRSRSFPPCSSR